MKRAAKLFMSRRINDEKGFVLILTMVMLATLSILGVMVLNTTNTELGITTNSRSNSDAFVAAELATEYAKQKVVSNPGAMTGDYDLATDDAEFAKILPPGITVETSASNEIYFFTGPAPMTMSETTSADAYANNIYRSSDSATSVTEGEAAYYRVSVSVKARGRSTAHVETLFVNRGGQVF